MREEKTNPIQLLERDIIMLPANGKSPIGLAKDCVWFDDNTLLVQDDKFELIVQAFKEDLISYQHLYVLSGGRHIVACCNNGYVEIDKGILKHINSNDTYTWEGEYIYE